MYFSQFPKIYYDFPQDETSTSMQILTDITTNVRVRKQVLENITLYDEYDIMEGETPEIIAEKVYGNPEYHWIIMLVNQKYDYLKDFPMSSRELDEYIKDKYGVDGIDQVHHYEKNDIITEGVAFIKIPASVINQLKVNDFILNLPHANARVNSIDLESNTATVLMDFGRFKTGNVVTIKGIREDAATGQSTFENVANFTIPTNGFVLQDGYTAITNYLYEVNENEKKRRIKLIAPELINQIVKEFRSLVTP